MGVLLPIVFIVGERFFVRGPVAARGSISAYYHSSMRDLFVGGLTVIAFMLATYLAGQISRPDYWLSSLAAIGLMTLVVFPTGRPGLADGVPRCGDVPDLPGCSAMQDRFGETTVATVHFTGAAVFIVSLALISFYWARREQAHALRDQAGPLTTSLGGWSLDARTRDAAPAVSATGTSLRIESPENTARRQEWTLFLPREDLRSISVEANAGAADLDVTGALLQSLSIQANAADTRIIAADADIASMDIQANAARSRITAGGDGAILIEANASSVELCVPPTASLAITVKDGVGLVTNLDEVPGMTQGGDTWQRAGTGGPSIVVQLEGNLSTFTLDPEEGCA